MNGKNPKVGDFIWIDSAPLIASPVSSGKLTEVEVLRVEQDQLYVAPVAPAGSPLYVRRSWVREGDTPGSIRRKAAAARVSQQVCSKVVNMRVYRYVCDTDFTNVKPEPSLMKWAEWFERFNRTVERTEFPGLGAVSTVFLGLDHSFGEGAPILFETMIFADGMDCGRWQARTTNVEDARRQHADALATLKAAKPAGNHGQPVDYDYGNSSRFQPPK